MRLLSSSFRHIALASSPLLLLPVVIVIIISSFLLSFLLRENSTPTECHDWTPSSCQNLDSQTRAGFILQSLHSYAKELTTLLFFYFQWVGAQVFADGYWPHIAPRSIYSNGIFSGWRIAHTTPAMIMRRGKAIFIKLGGGIPGRRNSHTGWHTLGLQNNISDAGQESDQDKHQWCAVFVPAVWEGSLQ